MQLKFEIEYDHVAYIIGPKGEKLDVGIVLVSEEDKVNCKTSILVKFHPHLPKAAVEQLIKEPRLLNYAKIAKKANGVVAIAELTDSQQ